MSTTLVCGTCDTKLRRVPKRLADIRWRAHRTVVYYACPNGCSRVER